jgi:hypothetical protein
MYIVIDKVENVQMFCYWYNCILWYSHRETEDHNHHGLSDIHQYLYTSDPVWEITLGSLTQTHGLLSNPLTMSVPDWSYSRNASCVIN